MNGTRSHAVTDRPYRREHGVERCGAAAQAFHPDLHAASNVQPPRLSERSATRLNRYEGMAQEPYLVEAARILLDAPDNVAFQLWVKATLEEGYFDCRAPGATAGDLACAMLLQRLIELKRIRAERLALKERDNDVC